jgi:hypothetical protein
LGVDSGAEIALPRHLVSHLIYRGVGVAQSLVYDKSENREK